MLIVQPEQLPLFNDRTDYFFERILTYISRLDKLPTHNCYYKGILLEAWLFAKEAETVGVEKAHFYVISLESYAKNAKIDLSPKDTKHENWSQISFSFD